MRNRKPTIIAAVVGATVVLIGVVGLLTRPGQAANPEPTAETSTTGPTATMPPTPEPPADPDTKAGQDFARQVASLLFDWDTATTSRDEVIAELIDFGAPDELNGLVADLSGYLPTVEQWSQLTDLQTRQWIDIDNIAVPDTWAETLAVAGADITPGTTAFTITGTRHRTGVWHGEAVDFQAPVAFTAFVTCQSIDGQCFLLRVSGLDNPLR